MKISIITVTYNSEKYLEETIQSVLSQTYQNIEYIIVDGNSTDGTQSIIAKYSKFISKVIIEDDESMYDAINKGIKASNGDVIAILNSDDKLSTPKSIEHIAKVLINVNVHGCYSNIINSYKNTLIKKKVFKVGLRDYILSGKGTLIPHTSLYLKRYVFDNVGLYNTDYRYASDLEFIIRVLKKYKLSYINKYLFVFRRHSESITSSGKIKLEREIILKENLYNTKFIELKKILIWSRYYLINISLKKVYLYLTR